jgi:hypothetical protein
VSANDATDTKFVTASCPGGKTIVGGGASLGGTAFLNAAIDLSAPNDSNGWDVAAHEHTATAGNWSARAFALCAIVQ